MRTVTLQDKTLHLKGNFVEEGKPLSDVTVQTADLEDVKLSSFFGTPLLILTVPSVDTSVCSIEGKTFNEKLSQLEKPHTVLFISRDLPFAQKRWCGAEQITNLTLLSDAKRHEVGAQWGLEVEEWGVLARSYLLVDEEGVVKHASIVSEISAEPPYEEIIKKLSIGF